MKLVANTLWTLSSQIYMAALSVAAVPFYLAVFGSSLYGLIAFFLQLQMVISLLDIGVSATVSRNTALFKADKLARGAFFSSVNSIELIFMLVAVCLVCFGFIGNQWLVTDWLNIENLDSQRVAEAVEIMFVIIALRWLQTFYRAALFGAELMVWLAKVNIVAASVRVLGVLPFLWWVSADIVDYFWFQLCANLVELLVLAVKSQTTLGYRRHERIGQFNITDISTAVKSSSVIGATSLIWALLVQLDKFVASGSASLSQYSAYSLVVTAASVMVLLSAPIIYTIGPKMATLLADQQTNAAVRLFRDASLFVTVLLSPAFAIALLWGQPLLWMWTADVAMANLGATFMPLYLTGTLVFALNYLSYSICFANGNFRLRLKLSLLGLACYLPVLALGVLYGGLDGLAIGWCLFNAVFFVVAQPLLYASLQHGLYVKSLIADIIRPLLGSFLVAGFYLLVDVSTFNRLELLVFFFVMFVIGLSGAVLLSRAGREVIRWKRQRGAV